MSWSCFGILIEKNETYGKNFFVIMFWYVLSEVKNPEIYFESYDEFKSLSFR